MNRSLLFHLIAVTVAVVWLFAVIFNYYIVHKPFTVENVIAILNVLGDTLVAVALVLLATSMGRRLGLAFAFTSPLEAIVLQAGLGLGLLSLATLALGLVGLLNPILFWLLLCMALFLLRGDVRSVWRDLRAIQLPIESRFERGLALFVAASLALAFLFALTPPVAWDAQTYHLVEAKVALSAGRITTPPDILYFSFPSLGQMLFLAAMLLKGDIAAQLIHFEFFLLTLAALFAFGLRHFGARVAWLATAILVAVPSLMLISTWAYVDLALVFYSFAAFYALIIAREAGDWRWFALSGALAGLAMGVKYTAAIVPIGLLILMLLAARSRKLSFVLCHLSFSALFAAPWYLRNLVFTGNPVYPFVFGGPYWDSFRAEWFSRFGTGLITAPLQLLTAPWDATIFGREGGLGYEATIGPMILALLPLVVAPFCIRYLGQLGTIPDLRASSSANLANHANKEGTISEDSRDSRIRTRYGLREMLLYAFILYLFWLIGIAESKLLLQTRLLFPAFPLLALVAAVAVEQLGALDFAQFSLQRFARLLIVLVLGLTFVNYGFSFGANNPLPYLVGAETREAFVARNLGEYDRVVQFVNTQLPAKANVLALWEPRSYYLHRPVQPDAVLDTFAHLRWQYRDANAIAAALRRAGYTHVLLNRSGVDYLLRSGYDPIADTDIQVLETLVTQYLKQVYGETPFQVISNDGQPALLDADNDPYAVYEIIATGSN